MTLNRKGDVQQICDYLGNELNARVNGREVRVRVGPAPIYIVGPTELQVKPNDH